MKIVYYYDEDKNPGGDALIGVPLRDLAEDDMAQFAKHTVASIEASPLYRKTKPESRKAAEETSTPAKKAPSKKKTTPKQAVPADVTDVTPGAIEHPDEPDTSEEAR